MDNNNNNMENIVLEEEMNRIELSSSSQSSSTASLQSSSSLIPPSLALKNDPGNQTESSADLTPTIGYGGRCMSTQAMQSLYEFCQNNLLCDAVIRLEDGGVFPVHRAILSVCSSYFRTLFTTIFYTQEKTDVFVPGVTSDVMTSLLKYAYLRSLDVNHGNVCQLLITANYLCMFGIIELCGNYLRDNLTAENCIGVLRFAKEHSCKNLENDTYVYIMRNFTEIAQRSEEIIKLSIDELCQLLDADELNVKSEEVVWEFILQWINYDTDNRKQYIAELIKTIRLGLLDTQYFLETIKDHPYVTSVETCRPIIIETLTFLYDLEMITHKHEDMVTPKIARPRVPHEILFVYGGWIGDNATSLIETYNTRADSWIPLLELDANGGGRAYHGAAVIGFDIYVIGGYNGIEYFSSCRCFNTINKTWREVAPMNSRRCYVGTAVLNDIIYAMGGFDGLSRLKTAERYDYRNNQWSFIASTHIQRSDASATTLKNKIYLTGGLNGNECINTAEVYDPATNQWTMIPPMRFRRSGSSCIAYHDWLYVIGGFNGISRMRSCEKYNPVTNTWSHVPNMYNSRSNFAIEIIDDMIFAIGGHNGVTSTFHVECYDEATNEWYEATDLNIYRCGHTACVIMGLPNIQDYIHKHREGLMVEKRQKLLALELQRNYQNHQVHQQQQQQQNQQNQLTQQAQQFLTNYNVNSNNFANNWAAASITLARFNNRQQNNDRV